MILNFYIYAFSDPADSTFSYQPSSSVQSVVLTPISIQLFAHLTCYLFKSLSPRPIDVVQ